ncbi:MAG: hypothetical protein HY678_09215 [Chloroflexi bacterium]|nr:hypothetical protein [Chloroflexota bacterium]
MGIAQDVHSAGERVALATEASLPGVLNDVLGRFLGWPFQVSPGCVTDQDRRRTDVFASVIHTPPIARGSSTQEGIPADTVGAIIDVSYSLDLDGLRSSYLRVAAAKSLRKTPAPRLDGMPTSTITMGLIFALRSALPLEEIAAELDRLNTQTPSRQWPDMVVIASTGVINYVGQFPGDSTLADLLPAAEGALTNYTPPMYVVIVMRPTAAYTFNKVMSFLTAHLSIFSPGARLPAWAELLEGVSRHAVVITGYQYNLSGELVAVPRHLYNDRYIAPPPVRIEDGQGNILSTIEFVPWQDGGTIVLRGQLPLEGLLIFLGLDAAALQRAGVVRRPDAQISYVLPITREHFNGMLARIHQQSNMRVRLEQPKLVFQKVSDEGTSSPFWARLLLGILRLRDTAFPDASARTAFDDRYDVVVSALLSARTAAHEILRIWDDHCRRVGSGEIGRLKGSTVLIDESIDTTLRKEVETFLNSTVRALKEGMQKLVSHFQGSIGFLYQKQAPFEKGVAALQKVDPLLAEYLRETRAQWSERLLESRNAIEHKGWTLPRVKYMETDGRIKVDEPLISGQPTTAFVKAMLDRLYCFVEELTVHSLEGRLPPGITVTEIPLGRRSEEAPERFTVTTAVGGRPPWRIRSHSSSFEET